MADLHVMTGRATTLDEPGSVDRLAGMAYKSLTIPLTDWT